jgi:transposase
MRLRTEKLTGTPDQKRKDHPMNKKKRYSRFAGIDIAKNKHVLCVVDRDGKTIRKSQSFANTKESYQQLRQTLKSIGQARTFLVGMEATAHYWYSLHDDLTRHGYNVVVLNPIQTAQQAKKGIRKCKTDKVDAWHIATLIKNGDYKSALVPGPLAMTCRQLTRLRVRLIQQNAALKQLIWSRLQPIWPEYEALFKNPFCATGRKLLFVAPSPADVLATDPDELSELIRKTSRGKYGAIQAQKVWQAAANSAGMQRSLDGARISIRTLLTQLEVTKPVHEQLKQEIAQLAQHLPMYLFSLPGIDPIRAVSLFGETDPITNFKTPSKLVAFSGLDLSVFQTGQYDAPNRRISKRGSPFLRHTLWQMAYQAVYQEGHLRSYWLRKKADGLKHKEAVTAAAIKLCHITWRILTDKRDYRLEGRPSQF